MLILNTGGTFNKIYDKKTGNLEVPFNNKAIEEILKDFTCKYDLAGVMYKDSLDMSMDDRKILANIIAESKDDKFLIVHGTDTMEVTAEFLDGVFDDRIIILTGAMKPFEIDKIEASVNLGMAFGFLQACKTNGVYICMNGIVDNWEKVSKNRDLGRFESVR